MKKFKKYLNDVEEGKCVSNYSYYIEDGNKLLDHNKYSEATKQYTKAFELEQYYSIGARYNLFLTNIQRARDNEIE